MSAVRARVNSIAPKQRSRSYPRYYLAHPGRLCLSRLSFNHRNLECREGDRIVVKPLSAIESKLGDRISAIPQVRSNFCNPPSAIEFLQSPKCDRISAI
ncbi:hypothetical protein QUB47_20965, partial [Microcoleus sp. AT9_B5]